MNNLTPKMLELAEQANTAFHARMGEGADKGTFYFNGFAAEFAELLIKECISVGYKAFMEDNSKVLRFPTEAIKNHFGG